MVVCSKRYAQRCFNVLILDVLAELPIRLAKRAKELSSLPYRTFMSLHHQHNRCGALMAPSRWLCRAAIRAISQGSADVVCAIIHGHRKNTQASDGSRRTKLRQYCTRHFEASRASRYVIPPAHTAAFVPNCSDYCPLAKRGCGCLCLCGGVQLR